MRVVYVRFPGRPDLSILSGVGTVLLYSGLLCSVLSLQLVFEYHDLWWITASLLAAAVLGISLIWLARWLFERGRPRVTTVTVDAETMARIQQMLAEQEAKRDETP